MKLNRRELCLAGIALQTAAAQPDWNAVRNDFPWLKRRLWISGADYHPIGIHSMRAMEKYLAWKVQGPGDGAAPFAGQQEIETKEMFARLINARSNEIAFVQSTTDGENLVVAGMRLGDTKGNVVIDDLHYQASKYLYRMLQKEGRIELRIVHHRGDPYWRVDPKDMEKAIDKNTRLVSLALVSNINGYLHDVRSTAAAAHAHGAYVYADIIQGAGAVPIDVKEMGIDFAACGAYKWLQGDSGFGFLYVREELQDSVVKRSRYGVRQFSSPTGAQADSQFALRAGAARYETGSFSYVGGACAHAALKYIHSLGIANIRAHAKQLTDRLQKELPAMGYPAITPPDNPTPIVSFRLPEYDKAAAKLRKAFPDTAIALRRWEFTDDAGKVTLVPGMRISPSVYNHHGDLDRLLSVLA